jgi:hypothetical protein
MLTGCTLPEFDVLVAFCKDDPQGYEQFRTQMLKAMVASANPKHRPKLASRLQQMEVARGAAKSPWDAALAAYSLMGESLNELNSAFHQLQWSSAELETRMIIHNLQMEFQPKTM